MEGATTIDSLQIEVSALSDEAVRSLSKLKDALSGIKTTIGQGIGFSNLSKDIDGISDSADKAQSKLDSLRESYEKLQGGKRLGLTRGLEKIADKLKFSGKQKSGFNSDSMQRTRQKVEQIPNPMKEIKSAAGMSLSDMKSELVRMAFDSQLTRHEDFNNQLSSAMEELQAAQKVVGGASDEMLNKIRASVTGLMNYGNTAQQVTGLQSALTAETENQASAFDKLRASVSSNDLGGGKLKSLFSKFLQFKIVHDIISGLFSSLREGFSNLIDYGKTFGSDFHKAIQSGSDSLLLLKNSIAAAASPIITALTPAFVTLSNWIIAAANALNQFLSILTGASSWTMAEPVSAGLSKVGGSAKKAKKQMDGLLADWDELNIIQRESESGDGAGGAGGSSLKQMFSEQEFSPWVLWVKDHLDIIKSLAIGIGAALLTWKISKMFGASLGNTLKLALGVGLTVAGVAEIWQGFANQLENGVNWENLKQSILGVVGVVAGLGIMFGLTGIAAGMLAGGVILSINPLKEWIETGKASTELLTQFSIGIALAGVGLALLIGSWIPLAVAAIGIGVAWVVGKWEEIKLSFALMWGMISMWWTENIQPAINTAVTWIDTNIVQPVSGFFTTLGQTIKDKLVEIGAWFTVIWETIVFPVVAWIDTNIVQPIGGFFSTLGTNIQSFMNDPIASIQEAWLNISTWFHNNVTMPISNFFIDAMNGIISSINFVIGALNSINFTIPGITIPGVPGIWDGAKLFDDIKVGISGIPTLELIPRVEAFAGGGFPRKGSLFLANENGAEMVGSFGNKTGVSNNEQIITGISEGVKSAISPLTQLFKGSDFFSRAFAPAGRLATASGYFDNHDFFANRGFDVVSGIVTKSEVVNSRTESTIMSNLTTGNENLENKMDSLTNVVTRILNKRFETKITPSSALARTVKRSEEMRLASEGV